MVDTKTLIGEMSKRKYEIFRGNYNLNVIGLRKAVPSNVEVNLFNDRICAMFELDGIWQLRCWSATTDPGKYWLENPMNVQGTAILAPGQYKDSHKLGLHKGESPALVQVGRLTVFRDANKDAKLDFESPTTGSGMGINIHRAGSNSSLVDKWSAGCQVFKRSSELDELLDLVRRQSAAGYGDGISYTLLDWPAADLPLAT